MADHSAGGGFNLDEDMPVREEGDDQQCGDDSRFAPLTREESEDQPERGGEKQRQEYRPDDRGGVHIGDIVVS